MTVSNELKLSYYRPVADIQEKHGVQLVQHTETGKFYVRKTLTVYNIDIFRQLRAHPVANTTKIYELVEDDGTLTVIEEYLTGTSLEEMLEEHHHFTEHEICSVILQLSKIVRDLHHLTPPVIHRDIKPSNILISPDHVVKLLDFNAAKNENDRESRDTVLLGTFGYAAPEQYGFAASSPQSDLYAIGVLLNVLVTGALPSEKKAGGLLAPIIQKCTELDPKNRFEDIDALIKSLTKTEKYCAQQKEPEKERVKQNMLPPGFRNGDPSHIILALVGYLFIFWMGFNLTSDTAAGAELFIYRVFFILISLAVIFFTFDYFNLQSYLPLTRSPSVGKRVFGILLYDFLLAFMLLLLMAVLAVLVS